jgi:polar amino acid transport system substrate-binding protein
MKRRMTLGLAAGLICVMALGGGTGTAQDNTDDGSAPATGTELSVATKPLIPFVSYTERGPEGFSIDLWDEIAARNGWTTAWVERETVSDVLDAVAAGDAQAGIAGISVTAEREESFDFSYPMFDSGLQIMINQDASSSTWSQLRGLISTSLLLFSVVVLGVLFATGNLVWLVQRRRGEISSNYVRGVGEGMWVSAATALAGDLGESAPRRPLSRFIAIVWILVGVIAVAIFTALTTSRLTVDSIESDIRGLADLGGREVVTVQGSTSDTYLDRVGLDHTTVLAIEDAYPLLRDGGVDAIVYDAPVLRHHANTLGQGREAVVGSIFNPEAYGIAFPPDSPLRESVNRSLLAMRADGTFARLYTRWFGDEG